MSLRDELPPRTMPGSIVSQSMIRYTRDAEHRAIAAEMKLWELENKVKVYPIGATSTLPEEKKNNEAREKTHKELAENKKPRSGKRSASGHQNIIAYNTCYTFMILGKYVISFSFKNGGNKEQALKDCIEYRDQYRKDNNLPAAEY